MSTIKVTNIQNPSSGTDDIQIDANGNVAVDTNTLYVDATNNRVGVGTTSPTRDLEVSRAGNVFFRVADTSNAVNLDVLAASSGGWIGTQSNHSLNFQTNNTERARIDSSGRLLVGTSSAPSTGGWNQYAKIVNQGNTGGAANGGVLAMNRGIAATSMVADQQLGVISFGDSAGNEFGTIICSADAQPGNNDYPGRLSLFTTADGASSPTEKLRIDNAGTILADGRNGTATHIFYSILPSAGTSRNHFFANTVGVGTWALQGNGVSTFTSDVRRKKNIETARDGYLEDLAQLRVVKYNWNVQSDDEPKELGLIAQEVEQVFPGLVVEADEPQDGDDYNLKSVKFSVLSFMLLKALQEASSKIETLEAKVAALESA